jgi:FKBP-type peptidyl-prolyl cis-trans isomerase
MQKSLTAILLTAGMLQAGSLLAQAPATGTTPAAPAKTTTGTTKKTTAGAKSSTTAAAPLVLTTPKQKASYAIGTSIGRKLHDDDLEIDSAVLYRALKDASMGKKPQLTDDEMRTALMTFQKEARDAAAAKNKQKGDAYMAENKSKEGVKTLPSGMQYKILKEGTGPKPTATDSVVCNYKGTFVDGKEFDSSYKRGEPATFPVTGVIKGWTEALQLMPTGSKWQLVIPPTLAYGVEGRPGMPPNSTLVFEVELVKIAEKEKPAPEAPGAQGGAKGEPSGTEGEEPGHAAPDAKPGTSAPGTTATPGTNAAPSNPAQPSQPNQTTPPPQPEKLPQR